MSFFGFKIKKSFNSKPMLIAGETVVNTTMKRVAIAITAKAKELCPKRYGYLAASINFQGKGYKHEPLESKSVYANEDYTEPSNRYKFIKGFSLIERPNKYREVNIGTNLEYAAAVEFGTRSHAIEVRNKKVLSDMTTYYGKSVIHPGQAAQPFMRPALDWSYDNFMNITRFKKNLVFREDGIEGLGSDEG